MVNTVRPKKKLSFVVNSTNDLYFLSTFQELPKDLHVEFNILGAEDSLTSFHLPQTIRLFSPIAEMPGYFRGIEPCLEDADIVLAVGSTQLGSFQALRAAQKLGLPFYCIMVEEDPSRYSKCHNIKAIQQEIFRHAQGFICYTKPAANSLLMAGVDPTKVHALAPSNCTSFSFNNEGRAKMREYLGVSPKEHLILLRAPLEDSYGIGEVLTAIAMIKQTFPDVYKNLRLLISGIGSIAKNLKYLAADLKIGERVAFMHQNPLPFLNDLYSAVDSQVLLEPSTSDLPEQLDRSILDAAACSVLPIAFAGSSVCSWFRGPVIKFERKVNFDIAVAIVEASKTATKQYSPNLQPQPIATPKQHCESINRIVNRVTIDENTVSPSSSTKTTMEAILDLTNQGKYGEALSLCQQLSVGKNNSTEDLAQICYIAGNCLWHLGKHAEATTKLQKSIELDPNCKRSYSILGKIAYASHASEEATRFFKKALASNPNDFESIYHLGLIYQKNELVEEACQCFLKSLESEKVGKKSILALTQSCLQHPVPKNAIDILTRVGNVMGDNPVVTVALGKLHIKRGDTERGRELLAQAIKSDH